MEEMVMEEAIVEAPKLKNLANCTPREFLVQTNKIRRYVSTWMDTTKIMEIRKRQPILAPVYPLAKDATEEQKANHNAIVALNQERINAQAKQNISDMLDAALETNADQTAVLLGMLCFIEPDDVDNHPIYEYLGAFAEIINCPEVLSFFTSLMKLGLTNTSGSAKA